MNRLSLKNLYKTRRIRAAAAAALFLLTVCAVPAFGAVPEAADGKGFSFETGKQQASPFIPQPSIENFSEQELPAATDETGNSRVYAAGASAVNHEKAPGPKLSAFMENAGLAHLLSIPTSAVFFSDKESEACSLFIIQYLHDQDGLKG